MPYSAAADRNREPICSQLETLLPPGGRILEVASGTGQHVVHFSAQLPGRFWQPTDRDAADFAALAARIAIARVPGIAAPRRLDVLDQDWALPRDFDALLCINMIHISPWETTPALFAGAARHLKPGSGLVVLYGPFREHGVHTASSNETFDSWLKEKDPRFGVRNLQDVDAVADTAGFSRLRLARMPANNLLLAYGSAQVESRRAPHPED